MPCSTPTNTTASSVIAARANSTRLKRAIAMRSWTWKSRSAMKMRTAASVASGTSLSTPAIGIRSNHDGRRPEQAGLGATPGRDHSAGPRRAGVDGERSDQAGHHAPGTDGQEITPGVDVVAALFCEGAGRRRGLGHDDERHHGGEWRQALDVGPGEPVEPHRWHARLDRAEDGHAVRLEVEDGDQDRRADQPDQRARDAPVEPDGHRRHEQHADADGRRSSR